MIRQLPETASRRAKLGYELTLEDINHVREIWRARLNAIENSDKSKPGEEIDARRELNALNLEELRRLRDVAATMCMNAQGLAFLAAKYLEATQPRIGMTPMAENLASIANGVHKQALELLSFFPKS